MSMRIVEQFKLRRQIRGYLYRAEWLHMYLQCTVNIMLFNIMILKIRCAISNDKISVNNQIEYQMNTIQNLKIHN